MAPTKDPNVKAPKKEKDPNAPKRPLTAYFFFVKEARKSVVDANPDMKVTEVSKELGRRWRELDEDEKAKYVKMAEKDKARYQREMEKLKK